VPTILVIEDDSAIQEAIVDILEMQGFQVLSAGDGLAGVAAAREQRPDLIICDIMMPFLDGYGVLARLRQYPQTATIPFIFLTARTTQSDFRQGMQLGADDYLAKPFRSAELVAAVNLRLQRQAQLADRFQKRVEALHSSLVTVLPHELRTPLNGILGGISLLKDEYAGLDPADAEELFIIVEQSALRLRRLVENCLLYAELASAAASPSTFAGLEKGEDCCAVAPTLETVSHNEAAAANREDDLRLDLTDGRGALPEASLAKIMEEVVNNAFKYSERGTPVTVAIQQAGDELQISVTDQGRGMSRDEIAAVGPFRQFNRTRFEQQGLGLGLAITQHILHQCGGKLAIESTPETGTTVRMTLRCATCQLET
jgi:two-component system, sensor histidine kinase and response regulator